MTFLIAAGGIDVHRVERVGDDKASVAGGLDNIAIGNLVKGNLAFSESE